MTATLDKKAYGKLLSSKLPHLISSPSEYDEARNVVRELMVKKDRTTAERELLKLYGLLLDQWQKSQLQLPKTTPAKVLEFLMESNEHRITDLANKEIADKGTLSKILSGQIKVSNEVAKRLSDLYKVSPLIFITFER